MGQPTKSFLRAVTCFSMRFVVSDVFNVTFSDLQVLHLSRDFTLEFQMHSWSTAALQRQLV